jgi:hypothetical protein
MASGTISSALCRFLDRHTERRGIASRAGQDDHFKLSELY